MKDHEPQTTITRWNILLCLAVMWLAFAGGQAALHLVTNEPWIRAIDRCFWMGGLVISVICSLQLWRR